MLRKLGLGLAVVIALGTAALAPSTASAQPWHHGWHGGGWHGGWHRGGWGWGGPRFYIGGPGYYGYGGCYVRRLVPTPWGWRYRLVNRCW